jgi:hypothetical protein
VRRNLILALVVGTILNAINQGTALMAVAAINWWQFGLNFCVPFLVASFGSWNSLRAGAAEALRPAIHTGSYPLTKAL